MAAPLINLLVIALWYSFGAPDSMTPEAQAYRCVEMGRRIHERVAEIDWGIPSMSESGLRRGRLWSAISGRLFAPIIQ